MTILNLPEIPASSMFIGDKDKIMTLEWQEFFRDLLKRVGGITAPTITELSSSGVSELYKTDKNYTKRVDELEQLIKTLIIPKSYDKRINDLEQLLLAQPSTEGEKLYEIQVTVPPAKQQNAGAGVPPVSAVFGNYIGKVFDMGDKDYYNIELPYGIFPGRPIHIELHWFIDEANDDPGGANEEQIQWRASYTLTKEDSTEAVDATSDDLDSGDIAIPGTAKYLIDTACGDIITGLFEEHDNLGITIERIAVTKDDPAADPVLLTVEIEYYSKYPGIPK